MFRIRTLHLSLRNMLLGMVFVCGVAAYAAYLIRQDLPLPIRWDTATGENVKWSSPLGSQTYSNPTVHNDFVLIGTNNEGGFDPLLPKKVDLGVLLCFEKATGKLLWQHSNRKLDSGHIQDWPAQGVTSQAFADGERVWYLNNRCEVVCLDIHGFRDQENDGPFKEEPTSRDIDADVIWKVSLIDRFDVFPHNISHCNVVVDNHRVYVKTCNGVNETHRELPSPEAPSFVVLDRSNGATIWTDNTPGMNIWHGSWGSPRLATIAGKDQILFPGGDGWLYSFEPAGDGNGNAKILWKFDGNPKSAIYKLGGIGTRNIPLTAPTVYRDKIYFTLGQDPEHGRGASRVWCIAPGSRRGDLSPTLVQRGARPAAPGFENGFRFCVLETGDKEIPNPNSALVWEYTGFDKNQDGQWDRADIRMDRSSERSQSRRRLGLRNRLERPPALPRRRDRTAVLGLRCLRHALDLAAGQQATYLLVRRGWNGQRVSDESRPGNRNASRNSHCANGHALPGPDKRHGRSGGGLFCDPQPVVGD